MTLPLRLPPSVLKSPFRNALKAMSFLFGDGMLLSGRPELLPMDLDRDFPEIEKLFKAEEWPFLRSDLEVSHAQPKGASFIARKDGKFAGFFACHHFGDVGYLDMMIIAAEFRRAGITRPLHVRTMKELKRNGLRSFVVHTTNDSAPLIRLLGFEPGQTFTLLGRDSTEGDVRPRSADGEAIELLGKEHATELVTLDGEIFGFRRPTWIHTLLSQPDTRFFGLTRGGKLVASICLRPRRNAAVCIDGVCARDFGDARKILRFVLSGKSPRTECFVKDGSELDRELRAAGFTVPDFFTKIGPLVEWRKGPTGPVGTSPRTQCLSWF